MKKYNEKHHLHADLPAASELLICYESLGLQTLHHELLLSAALFQHNLNNTVTCISLYINQSLSLKPAIKIESQEPHLLDTYNVRGVYCFTTKWRR